jgi:Lamin Tail Domain/Calx-beta domain
MVRVLTATLAASFLFGLLDASAVQASAGDVVISEFRFRGPAGANDEFVEIRNAGAAPVDISGWKLQVCAAASGAAATRLNVPAETMLDVGEHYLFAHASYTGSAAADASYAIGIADEGGVRIGAADGSVVDGVGSSSGAVDECREGAGLVLPTANSDSSFERAQDTGDNAADFTERASDPQGCAVCTAATPTVSVGDASVQEGDAGAATVQLTVSLARPVTAPVAVGIATKDENAVAPADYAALQDTVVFAPGERTKTVSVSVAGDVEPEPDETFALELSAPAGVAAADPTGRVTIVDDDEPASSRCTVFALGRVDGRPRSLLVVAADSTHGARPRGFVAYVDAASKTRHFFSSFTSLTVAGGRATLSGTAFRLELGPQQEFSLSYSGGSVSGTLQPGGIALRCTSP